MADLVGVSRNPEALAVGEHRRAFVAPLLDRNPKDGQRPPRTVNLFELLGVQRPSVREMLKTFNQVGLMETYSGEKAFAQTTHRRKASVE